MLRATTLAGYVCAAVGAVDRGNIADRNVRNVGHIEHGHIHRDDSDDRGNVPANGNRAPIAQRAMDAVAITCGENRDARGPLRYPTGVVADAYAAGDRAYIEQASAQTHHRPQREFRFKLEAPFHRVEAGMIPVEERSGTHHVCPSFRTRRNGGAVGNVNDSRSNAQRTQAIDRLLQPLQLFRGLVAGGRIGQNFRRGQMREGAVEFQVLGIWRVDCAKQSMSSGERCPGDSCRCQSSGESGRAACAAFAAAALNSARCSQRWIAGVRLYAMRFFSSPGQNPPSTRIGLRTPALRSSMPSPAEATPNQSEPNFSRCFGDVRAAVSVAVAFDDAENLARRFAFFRRRIHVIADRFQILPQSGERNFRPDGTAYEINRTFFGAGHEFSRKVLVYGIRAEQQKGLVERCANDNSGEEHASGQGCRLVRRKTGFFGRYREPMI